MDAASCRGLVFSDEGKRLEVAFGTSGPVLLALVNARTQDQTLGEARRARLRRVHGVMIRHQMRKDSEFFRTYEMAHHCNPGTWNALKFSYKTTLQSDFFFLSNIISTTTHAQ